MTKFSGFAECSKRSFPQRTILICNPKLKPQLWNKICKESLPTHIGVVNIIKLNNVESHLQSNGLKASILMTFLW